MTESVTNRTCNAVTVLQWTLGIVVLIESALFVSPRAGHSFVQTHMPQAVRLTLGWAEIVAAIFFLIPKTAVRAASFLIVLFMFAIAVHLLHGMLNVGALVVYAAAAWTVAAEKRSATQSMP